MKYDIFISYTHLDNMPPEGKEHGWVDSFHIALNQNLSEFLGRKPVIFFDKVGIEGYQKLTPSVFGALENTLLLIPILSPGFFNSEWCPNELKFFNDLVSKSSGRQQIFSIVKTPIEGEDMPAELRDNLRKFEFFQKKDIGDDIIPLRPGLTESGENKFFTKVNDLAQAIKKYIKTLPSDKSDEKAAPPPAPPADGPCIYLAEPSPDLWDQYEDIRRDLVQRGNAFIPTELNGQAPKPQSADVYRQSVRDEIAKCRLAVNLVGKSSNGYPRLSELSYQQLQMEVAAERDVHSDYKRLIWLPKDIQIDDPEQQKFIDDIRNSASSRVEFIQNSLEEFKSCIQDSLKPPPPPPVLPPPDEPPWVYVLYDKSDLEPSREVENMLYDQNCAVLPTRAYLEPALNGDTSVDVNDQHKTWLNTCDAVLIYWNSAPTPWVLNKILELQRIKAERKGRGFRARAVFCDGDVPAEQKTRFLPPIGSLLKMKGYSELPAFLSQLEVPVQ
jgi:hypothetical protein